MLESATAAIRATITMHMKSLRRMTKILSIANHQHHVHSTNVYGKGVRYMEKDPAPNHGSKNMSLPIMVATNLFSVL